MPHSVEPESQPSRLHGYKAYKACMTCNATWCIMGSRIIEACKLLLRVWLLGLACCQGSTSSLDYGLVGVSLHKDMFGVPGVWAVWGNDGP